MVFEESFTYCKYCFQLILVNFPIAILVKKFEVPLEFLVNFPLEHQANSSDIFHKIYVSILIKKEREEQIFSFFFNPKETIQAVLI